MRQKEKLIVTLWRGQLNNPSNYQSVCCRMLYNQQEQTSRHIHASKSLTWKQTFVFPLAKFTTSLKLDFINMQQIQQIHFARDQILDSLAIGKCEVNIDLDNSNRGTIPAKLLIRNDNQEDMGMVFLQYQILKTEVTYIVQKLLDYEYMIKLYNFKITFTKQLRSIPSFYLKFIYGNREHKEDFSFEELGGVYFYNYPIKLYMKNEAQISIELQMKDSYRKDYRNPNTSFDTQSVVSNSVSIKKNSIKKNQPIDLRTVDNLCSVLDLTFKKNQTVHKKLPLNISVKGMLREIADLQFDADIVYKTKKQKQQLQIQKKRDLQLKNDLSLNRRNNNKKKQKKYQPPKNGNIIINSIIAKYQASSEELLNQNDVSIQLKLGKIIQTSAILEQPGRQIIWMDTFTFKRTWQETIKFTLYIHSDSLKIPKFYAEVNLRQLFDIGRYMAKKLSIKDQKGKHVGALLVDISYRQEQQKPKPIEPKKLEPEISPQQKLQIMKKKKKEEILERMKRRSEEKAKRKAIMQPDVPIFSDKQIYLPPLRSSRNSLDQSTATLSPRKANYSNIYNTAGKIFVGKSARFDYMKKQDHGDSYFYRPQSDFQKKNKGASIGIGNKYDFTKAQEKIPGAGRYEIPSVWDKYK